MSEVFIRRDKTTCANLRSVFSRRLLTRLHLLFMVSINACSQSLGLMMCYLGLVRILVFVRKGFSDAIRFQARKDTTYEATNGIHVLVVNSKATRIFKAFC